MLQWEQPWLERAIGDVFGYHAVQLGLPQVNFLADSRMPNRWIVSQQTNPIGLCMHSIVSEFEELPFASQSVDLVVAPHVLEFSADPHQVLREIDRILIPEGRLFVTGLNPLSLWGMRQATLKHLHPVWPLEAHPIGVPRLRDLLKLLSFETEMGRFGCYRWPSQNESRLQGGAFMEKAWQLPLAHKPGSYRHELPGLRPLFNATAQMALPHVWHPQCHDPGLRAGLLEPQRRHATRAL